MSAIIINSVSPLTILLILFASANIIKVNSVKILKKSSRLEPDQIKSGVIIVNTIFYTILTIILIRLITLFANLVVF